MTSRTFGPRRPHPLEAIRLVCRREGRNPQAGEVVSLAGTSTRVAWVRASHLPRRLSVTFTCHGVADDVTSTGIVLDLERGQA